MDAFAGVGQYEDADQRAYVNGSPLVALKCEPPFDEYVFIERIAGRLQTLSSIVAAQ